MDLLVVPTTSASLSEGHSNLNSIMLLFFLGGGSVKEEIPEITKNVC